MGDRESTTAVNVQIAVLGRLSPKQAGLCHALGKEARRCWTDMLKAQVASRGEKKRLSVDDLEKQPEKNMAALDLHPGVGAKVRGQYCDSLATFGPVIPHDGLCS